MDSMVDPSAGVLWDSVAMIVSAEGTEERQPRTDEVWTTVHRSAVTLAEATNLLLMEGRHVAKSGEKAEDPDVELSPEETELQDLARRFQHETGMAREDVQRAVSAGLRYYISELFDASGLPRPLARQPRLTLYRRELYDYAECITPPTLVAGWSAVIDERLARTVKDSLKRWQRPDGSFCSRQLAAGWDNVPMHRWARAPLFRNLGGLISTPPL